VQGMFPIEGRKSLSAPVATNKVRFNFFFLFLSILSRIIAKPADLVENLTHIIPLCIHKSVDHVFLFSRTWIGDNFRKSKPNPSGGGLGLPRPTDRQLGILPSPTDNSVFFRTTPRS
jgi:hypothetical protein